jgi:hypothetical protein
MCKQLIQCLIVFSYLSIFALDTQAQNQRIQPAPPPAAIAESPKDSSHPPASLELSQKSEEVLVLQTQNKLIKDYQSSLMDTVLWALGVVCTIAVFIAGFGWWSNFKVYENDKKRLKEELDLSLAERIAQLELRLTSSNADFTRVIEARVEAMLNRAYAEQTALQAKINELATKLEELSKRLVAAKKDNLQVNAALRRVEETVWDIRDIPENILVTQSQGLEAELEADLISNAKWTLERMKKVLEKSFINGNEHMSRGTIEILLDALPTNISELGVELTAVRSLLERVNVVEDVET